MFKLIINFKVNFTFNKDKKKTILFNKMNNFKNFVEEDSTINKAQMNKILKMQKAQKVMDKKVNIHKIKTKMKMKMNTFQKKRIDTKDKNDSFYDSYRN